MNSIKIRNIEVGDIDRVIRIYSDIIRKKVDNGFKNSIKKQAAEANDQVTCYVADDDGKVVGFMIGHVLAPGFGIEKSAWIASFGVDLSYMGQDIGKLLANKFFNFYKSKGIDVVYTSVLWDSTDVLSFFKALGFDRSRFIELQKEL